MMISRLDRTRFKIAHDAITITFEPDTDVHAEPPNERPGEMARRIVVDWNPSLNETLEQLQALPIPTNSLSPDVDAYVQIVIRKFGPCTILSKFTPGELDLLFRGDSRSDKFADRYVGDDEAVRAYGYRKEVR